MRYATDVARDAEAGARPGGEGGSGGEGGGGEPLPELCVGEGFDAEQVWLQMDLQLAPLVKLLRSRVGQLLGSFQAAAVGGAGSSGEEEEGGEGRGEPRRRRRRRGGRGVAAVTLVPPEVERDIDELLEDYEGPGAINRSGSGEEEDGEEGEAGGGSGSGSGSEGEGEQGRGRKRARGAAGSAGTERERLPFEDRWGRTGGEGGLGSTSRRGRTGPAACGSAAGPRCVDPPHRLSRTSPPLSPKLLNHRSP
jgi:hypothetical protein